MKLAYDFYKSILVINADLKKEEFLSECGSSSGYSKQVFERIYESIYSELVDLRREYDQFYKMEYESFEKFLYRKLNISPDDIESLIAFSESKNYLKIFKYRDYSSGDYGIGSFIYSEAMYDRIMALIT